MSNEIGENILDFAVEKAIVLLPTSDKTKLGLIITYELGKLIYRATPEIRRYREQKDFQKKLQRIEQDLVRLILSKDIKATQKFLYDSDLSYSQQASILAAFPVLELELRKQRDQISEWNQRIIKFIELKEFDEAVRFVQSLDLSEEERGRVVSSIRNFAKNWRTQKAQVDEWNARLRELLSQGRLQDAVDFVRSLSIAEDEKMRVIRPIAEALKKQQWNNELLRLSGERKAGKALDFLLSLPISNEDKEAIKMSLREYWRDQVIRIGDEGPGDPRRNAYYYLQTLPLYSKEEKEEFHMQLLDRWYMQDRTKR